VGRGRKVGKSESLKVGEWEVGRFAPFGMWESGEVGRFAPVGMWESGEVGRFAPVGMWESGEVLTTSLDEVHGTAWTRRSARGFAFGPWI